jgi:hypothetical protein
MKRIFSTVAIIAALLCLAVPPAPASASDGGPLYQCALRCGGASHLGCMLDCLFNG